MKKTGKKLLNLLLCLAIVLTMIPVQPSFAAEETEPYAATEIVETIDAEECVVPLESRQHVAATEGYYTYTIADGAATITDCNTAIKGNVVVPATLGGCPVTAIGSRAFEKCVGIDRVILPNGIVSLGGYAFSECTNLHYISMPNSIATIGTYVFNECVSLESAVLPSGLSRIPNRVFNACTSLRSVTIPARTTGILQYAFANCTSLTDVYYQGTQEQWDEINIVGDYTNQVSKAKLNILPRYLYWNVDRQKAAEGGTARTPDAEGFYHVQLAVNGEVKHFKTREKAAINYVDNSNGATVLALATTDGGEFTEASSALSAEGVEAAGPINLSVSAINGNQVSLTGKNSTSVYTMAEDCGVFDVSGKSAFIGARTQLLIGDTFRSYVDEQKQLLAIFVLTRTQVPEIGSEPELGPNDIYAAANRMGYDFAIAGGGSVQAECPVCGTKQTWTALAAPSGSTALASGHYYLAKDMNITGGYYSVKSNVAVCINLNGKYMKNTTERVFFVDVGAKLNIMGSGVVSGGRSKSSAAERCGSALEIVGSTDTVVNLYGGTFKKTRADLDTIGIRGRIASTLNIYDGTVIAGTENVGGNGLWVAGGTVNIHGGVMDSDVYVRTYTDGVTSAARPVNLAFCGGQMNGKVVLDNSKGSAISVSLAGAPVMRELVVDSTLLLRVGALTTGADITVTADGVFTEAFEDAQSFCSYFYATEERKEILAEGNVLKSVRKPFISGSCGNNVTWKLDAQDNLTISGSGEMDDYSYYSGGQNQAPWSTYADLIREIRIEEGVTTVGSGAFAGCFAMTAVAFPESLTGIGDYGFEDCVKLKSVTIPDNVISIGYRAFEKCSDLASLTMGSGVEIIDINAFAACAALTAVTIPQSVTTIGDAAFSGCTGLTEIAIPDGITAISGNTFFGCTGLKQVTMGSNVTSIGVSAFSNCTALTAIEIPKSVTEIGLCAFSNTGLKEANIPDSVTTLVYGVFSGCRNLESITVPSNVTSIHGEAIENCEKLLGIWVDGENPEYSNDDKGVLFNKDKTVLLQAPAAITEYTVPETVREIGKNAFHRGHLKKVTIPGSVETIGVAAFRACDDLVSVTIGEGVAVIGEDAFSWCGSLPSIAIPQSVMIIEEDAFSGSSALTGIWVEEENPVYSSDEGGGLLNKEQTTLIQGPSAVDTYVVPDTVTTIAAWAFYYCNLKSVIIPNSVTSIGEWAFYHCSNLTAVRIPAGVTTIPNLVFGACSSLTEIVIPDRVTSIGYAVFSGCTGLRSVVLSGSVDRIRGDMFSGCINLQSVVIERSVTDIDYEAFYSCASLMDVYYTGTANQWKAINIQEGNGYLKEANVHYVVAKTAAGEYHSTLAAAIENAAEGQEVVLLKDIASDVNVSKDLFLDLNGYDLTGTVTVAEGCTLYGMDSQTDDFTVEDGKGYGKMQNISGNVVGLPYESGIVWDSYLAVTEDDGISFHRVGLQISALSLRAKDVGVYYTSTFRADEVATARVKKFGVALSVVPNGDQEQSLFSEYTGFVSGRIATGTLLHNILKTTNDDAVNAANAAMPIYGRAYIETEDGYLFGACVSHTLRQLVESVDTVWDNLSPNQKASVLQMYETYTDVMKNWEIPNTKKAQ